MILFENTSVKHIPDAARGARNPLQSWGRSDSFRDEKTGEFVLGDADYKLLLALATAGPEHGKFMREISVTVDITAPVYFLRELDQYKVGTTSDSSSLQHTGASRDFTIEDFTAEGYENQVTVVLHGGQTITDVWDQVIKGINELRAVYKDTRDYMFFRWMRQLMPMGYNYLLTWGANYGVLRNIYHQRRNHELQEWRDFCAWIETLPYSKLITKKLDDWISADDHTPESSAMCICAIEATLNGEKTTYVEPCYYRKSTGEWETAKGYRLDKSACRIYKWKPLPPAPDVA